jgi:succinate-semialdehyde dehydrogenase / glutarate-semialdehyde dehydrogenase
MNVGRTSEALKKAARIVNGGKRATQGGTSFEPTVLTDVTTGMIVTKEETFGPVAPLYRLKTEEEVIAGSRIAAVRTTRGPAGN